MSYLQLKILAACFLWLILPSCNNAAIAEEDEIATIKHESWGCFGGTKSTITFVRKDGFTFAKVRANENNKVTRVAKIRPETLDAVIEAIRHLKRESGCTSTDKYTVQTRSETFIREDRGCQDTGFSDLLREIFDRPK